MNNAARIDTADKTTVHDLRIQLAGMKSTGVDSKELEIDAKMPAKQMNTQNCGLLALIAYLTRRGHQVRVAQTAQHTAQQEEATYSDLSRQNSAANTK